MSKFYEMSKNVKLIVSEVDGIITEGQAAIDNMNNTLFKFFYLGDFEAINLLKKHYNFVFLSSDNNVTYNIMRTRNIPFFWAKQSKKEVLTDIMHRYSVNPEKVMYIGCNFSDLECIDMIPFSFCPNDAVDSVRTKLLNMKDVCGFDGILDTYGGYGVLSEVYEKMLPTIRKNLTKDK
jgi:3-deoxy-D-manno-octulosonate 8-phosphate phosphatase KdsC-like HAD superfamily phosphatase